MKSDLGNIYLVATPIGNLEDMTFRAIRILKEVDLIAAEDTRNTRKLLSHFDIHTPMTSYHEHNKNIKTEELINFALEGKNIAVVSDAGLPGISDPGTDLVKSAIENNISIIPIPGANAALTGLIASGLDTNIFTFIGFLPKTSKNRKELLDKFNNTTQTLIFYESPHRILKTLEDMKNTFGENRNIVLARELTKKFESFWRGNINEAIFYYENELPRGEFVILVEGGKIVQSVDKEIVSPLEYVNNLIEMGISKKEAMRQTAVKYNVSRRDIYNLFLKN